MIAISIYVSWHIKSYLEAGRTSLMSFWVQTSSSTGLSLLTNAPCFNWYQTWWTKVRNIDKWRCTLLMFGFISYCRHHLPMALTESEEVVSKSYTKSGIFNVFPRYRPCHRKKSEHAHKTKTTKK